MDGRSARGFEADCRANLAVAPVIANHAGARRAGQGRDSGEHGERTLDVPKRFRIIEYGSDVQVWQSARGMNVEHGTR
jgi:hypothetical protein